MCRDSNSYLLPLFPLPLHGPRHKGPIPKKSSWMHDFVSAWVTARANMCLNGYLSFYLFCFQVVLGFITDSLQLLVGSGLDVTSLRVGQVSGGHQNGAWAVTDWVPIMVKSSLALGMLPLSTGVICFA